MEIIEKTDLQLHQEFQEYGNNARLWMRKCVLLLPEIRKREIWKKRGFGSIYEYAAKLSGMSHKTVNEALRVFEKIADKPLLQEIAAEKGINILKPIVNVVAENTEEFWADKAKSMSKNTLEAYVREFKNQNGFPEPKSLVPGNQFVEQKPKIEMELSAEIINQLQKLKGDKSWDELMEELLVTRKKQLEAEKPEAIISPKGYIPARLQKYINKKTNGQCAFGNCLRKTEFFHHRNRFALNHTHDPDSIVGLCRAHHDLCHHSLVNEKTWTVLLHPDKNQSKYLVDRKVAAYRR